MKFNWNCFVLLSLLLFLSIPPVHAGTNVESRKRYPRLIIRNATVIDGNGTPASGPKDIVIEGNRIVEVVALDPVAIQEGEGVRPEGDVEIDATGKYVLPGLVNMHAHVQNERGGKPLPVDYCLKLWLASGITTIRDVGSDTKETIKLRSESQAGEVISPRVFVYGWFPYPPFPSTPELAVQRVRELKEMGVDGIKIVGLDRDLLKAMEDEARKLNLPVAHHVGVEETNVSDDIRLGTRSIEHWYGIPDAAILSGRQNFPAEYNYNNELDRFRYAGRLWREADPEKLSNVLQSMVDAGIAWDPTLVIYEANRDLQRAQNAPWFAEYLHPTMDAYFRPDAAHHGSYFLEWTTEDEIYWKENYRIWMNALMEFEKRGGVITAGEDAGFIYQIQGFGLIRELELHQEAGFHPLKVIQHATGNAAKVLGQADHLGRVRAGYLADLLVVNGNPLENFKVLYPTGVEKIQDGRIVHTGGVEWTIKDGIVYHAPTLLKEVKDMVTAARTEENE